MSANPETIDSCAHRPNIPDPQHPARPRQTHRSLNFRQNLKELGVWLDIPTHVRRCYGHGQDRCNSVPAANKRPASKKTLVSVVHRSYCRCCQRDDDRVDIGAMFAGGKIVG